MAPRDMYIVCHWRVLDEADGTILIAVWSDTGTYVPMSLVVSAFW